MDSPLLSALPIALVVAAILYAAVIGEKVHGSTGAISILGIAVTMLGLMMGWLLQRFGPTTRGMDDWLSYRSLRIEVALLFSLVALFSFLAVNLMRRDLTGRSKADTGRRKFASLASMFLLAVCIPARGKLVAYLVVLLTRSNP
jgi:formate hydrogenlyase subunit 3/multisubunit Na+/H+ antiporter MnhD subunit